MIYEIQPEPLEGAMRVTFDMQDAHVGDEFAVPCSPLATFRHLTIWSDQSFWNAPGERELPVLVSRFDMFWPVKGAPFP